jgi:hypothetical protein
MRGLDPRIHIGRQRKKDVDGRVKPGHDGEKSGRAVLFRTPYSSGSVVKNSG